MSILFFSLRGVPDDEAQDVRELLTEHEIDFYETPAGNWGMSMPALWLRDETQLIQVRALLDDYQTKRAIEQRTLYLQNKKTLWQTFKENPLLYLACCSLIVLIVYVSIKFLFELGL